MAKMTNKMFNKTARQALKQMDQEDGKYISMIMPKDKIIRVCDEKLNPVYEFSLKDKNIEYKEIDNYRMDSQTKLLVRWLLMQTHIKNKSDSVSAFVIGTICVVFVLIVGSGNSNKEAKIPVTKTVSDTVPDTTNNRVKSINFQDIVSSQNVR